MLEELKDVTNSTLVTALGIEITKFEKGCVKGRMPVDERTKQPFGLLHGGASVALAESIGSVGSNIIINSKLQYAVGLSINANHIRSAKGGDVIGKGVLVHNGKSTHVWNIEIKNENDQLVSTCRLTVMIINKNK